MARNNAPNTYTGARGKFRPGNPGRPKGARHKTTLAIEAILEGDKNSVEDAISWFRVGPPDAHVEKIKLSYDRYSGEFEDFKISY